VGLILGFACTFIFHKPLCFIELVVVMNARVRGVVYKLCN